MRLKALIAVTILACSGSAALAHEPLKPSELSEPCIEQSYQSKDYSVCRFDPSVSDIRLFLNDDAGKPLGSFSAVNAQLSQNDEQLAFAMNAGMYLKDRAPVGLYIEGGAQQKKINTKPGPGNFHMLPNGVFWLSQFEDSKTAYKGAGVAATQHYPARSKNVMDATQSGPMLVIDGKMHPTFKPDSTSLKIRNGVGQKGDTLFFVKSETPVSFHEFASFYKDVLGTKNALYLDGTISRLYAPNLGRNDFGAKMGPIVGVVVPKVKSQAQYIANEAILISHGETKVMFDPLPLSGFGTYPEPSFADTAKMMSGQGEFAGMDAVFISHAHRDHFSAVKMISYMTANPEVRLVAPRQALDMMQADTNWDASLLSHMTILDMEAGDAPEAISIGDITATAVRIPHAGWPAPARAAVQNMVYRVTLGDEAGGDGATIMHMGDADPRRQHYIAHKDHWAERRTDTAFPPYWFLTSMQGRNILSDDMNVAKSIGIHVPIEVPADLKESGQDYFSKSGETREIGE
ncbi:MAG: phosphodiester glycosidase family protein [Hellea sp.]